MAVIEASIVGCVLDKEHPDSDLKIARLSCTLPIYSGAADTLRISNVGALIGGLLPTAARGKRNGKTITLRWAQASGAGKSAAGTSFYFGTLTVASDTLTGNLTNIANAEIDAPAGVGIDGTAAQPMLVDVCYTEA